VKGVALASRSRTVPSTGDSTRTSWPRVVRRPAGAFTSSRVPSRGQAPPAPACPPAVARSRRRPTVSVPSASGRTQCALGGKKRSRGRSKPKCSVAPASPFLAEAPRAACARGSPAVEAVLAGPARGLAGELVAAGRADAGMSAKSPCQAIAGARPVHASRRARQPRRPGSRRPWRERSTARRRRRGGRRPRRTRATRGTCQASGRAASSRSCGNRFR